ncbi:MAG: hypothetical protein R3A79_19935 [Nannocystaceae bacterium]
MTLRSKLQAHLDAPDPDRRALLELVRLLDLALREALGERDEATLAFIDEAVARMVIAGAPFYLDAYPRAQARAAATLAAAERFVAAPSESTRAAYTRAATSSYPFGPGDGCFAVPELGDHGTPGAGCAGGVGCVAYLAPEDAATRLVLALRRELGPWLRAAAAG